MITRLKVYTSSVFGIIVVLVVVVASITYLNLNRIEEYARHHSEESMPYELLTDEIEMGILKTQELLTDTALTGQPNGFALAGQQAKLVLEGLEKSKEISRKEDETAVLRELDAIEGDFRVFYSIGRDMASRYLHGETAQGDTLMRDFDTRGEDLLERYESVRQLQIHKQKADGKRILETVHQAKVLLLSTCLVAVAASLIAAFTILSLKVPGENRKEK